MFPELHETFILRELVAMERHGVDFDIFSLQFPRDPITIEEAIRLSNTKTHYSKLFTFKTIRAITRIKWRHPLRYLRMLGKLIWIGRDRPKEIIKNIAILPLAFRFAEVGQERGITHWHGHWANIPTTACWALQQTLGVSWSAAIHGEDIFTQNRFLQKKLDDASFTVVCSGYFCQHLKQNIGLCAPEQVHLNYHGLDPYVMERSVNRTFKTRSKDGPLKLISVGRLVPTKGHDVVISALGKLKRDAGLPFHLTLIGSGPEQSALQSLANSEGVADNITFQGGMAFADVVKAMEESDIFCLAPRLIPGQPPDGIPNVIAEAMALRIPVVSTAVSAIPELIENEVTGRLVPVDDVTGFSQAIADLAQDEALAQRLSEKGYLKVSRLFDQNNNIEELLDLFRRYVPGLAVT